MHAKGMAIRGLVRRGPAPLGRMSDSEPFAGTWGPSVDRKLGEPIEKQLNETQIS